MAAVLRRRGGAAEGIRRILRRRLGQASKVLEGEDRALISDLAVHRARTRLKQARALLRLMRHDLGRKAFERNDRLLRDAGRPLSRLRDATVLLQTAADLAAGHRDRLTAATLRRLRTALAARRRRLRRRSPAARTGNPIRATVVRKVARHLRHIELPHHGWKTLRPGLRRIYGHGREALRRALRTGSSEHWHELRKRTKDLRYAIELLRPLHPAAMRARAGRTHRFTGLLGEDHDLAVLQALIGGALQRDLPAGGALRLQSLIGSRRAQLQREARPLGQALYRESTHRFIDRMHRYWQRR